MINTMSLRRGAITAGAVALSMACLASIAQAAPPTNGGPPNKPADDNVSTSITALAEAQAAENYWTPERMASAKPVDLPQPAGKGGRGSIEPNASGTPVTVTPQAGSEPAPSSPEPLHAGTVTRPYTNLPDRLNGKVFFVDERTRTNYQCSGTVVNSANKDMIDTAGHCVSDGAGYFYKKWTFVPAYSSSATGCTTVIGCRPYGTWTARKLTTRTEWHNHGNFKQDYGYAVLNTLSGRHIASYLGGHGSAFNQSRTQTWTTYGYPAAAPFNGFDQRVCVSSRLADDNPSTRTGPLTIRIHCNMTAGSSGGGSVIRISSTGLGYVNSHVSYRYTNLDHLYIPYYGNEALSLFNSAQAL